jgi:hypothetical protein
MNREPLVPHDAAQTLAAGGIVGKGAKLPVEERTTAVAARAYSHPALPPDRVIVRLEPAAVAEGTDAEMAAFGFLPPEVGVQLGEVRYRTLGFPAWGLVNAPKAGKVALGVMEDVRKAKRLVAAKPGHAKEAFEKIAKTLQKASPQLLPSFWEEVGRTVADLASATLAAQCFERARQAERAFKLKVDADDGDAVFLEFALLGALSAKTLAQYAKDLAKSEGGAQAYKRFRTIAVKRALGGMPPWSGMGKDLRSLAKGAELDIDREDEQLVAELLEAPAINKAPNEFWQTYRDAIARLAKRDATVHTRLRGLWPEPKGQSRENIGTFRDAWIALLDEVGALGALPDDGLGAWFSRLIAYSGATPRVLALMTELAPRLATQPIHVLAPRKRWGTGLSLDLAERALELGIPLADDEDHSQFEASLMSCDPVRVAAHPVYGPKLVSAVEDMIGNAESEGLMRGKPGFDAARATWIEGRLERLASHPLGCAVSQLEELETKTTAQSFLAFPALYERFRTSELAGSLATTLRGGLVDEFSWPAYEAAAKQFEGPVRLGGAFPILTMWNATKAIAVGSSGVVGEHDLVYKDKEHSVEEVMFLDGQFLVVLDPVKGYGNVGYWSNAPKNQLDLKGVSLSGWDHHAPLATTLSDGSITLSGADSFRAGDVPKSQHNYSTDGVRFWQYDYRAPKGQLNEYDPIKAQKVGASLPEFFTRESATPPPPSKDGKPTTWELVTRSSSLGVAPAGYASSPLGIANGLTGLRVLETSGDDSAYEIVRIDGLTSSTDVQLTMVVFPGEATPRRANHERTDNDRFLGGNGPGVELYAGDDALTINNLDWTSRGWAPALVPALAFWHMFVARDVAGSTRLRTTTIEQARALIAIAGTELAGTESGRAMPKTEAALREMFGVSDAALARGIAGVVEYAAEQAARIAPLAAERSKDNADATGVGLSTEGLALKKLFAAVVEGRETKFKDFSPDLDELLGYGRGAAMLALSPLETAEKRHEARDQLRALAATPFIDDTSQLRYLNLGEPDNWNNPDDYDTVIVRNDGGSTFAIGDGHAIELSRDGQKRVPAPWIFNSDHTYGAIGSAWARAYLELPDETVPWDPEIAVQLAAKSGLSIPEATMLYLGMPTGYRKDFLGKQKRDLVGLKVNEADAAKTTFAELKEEDRKALFDRAAPSDPALLRTPLAPGGFVDGLARAWKEKFGKRAKVPQELIVALKKDLELHNELSTLLQLFTGEPNAKLVQADLRPLHELDRYGTRDEGLNYAGAQTVATLVAWMFLARPVGDPIRANLVDVVAALKKVVDDPRVIWMLAEDYFGDDPADKKKLDGIFAHVGGKPVDLPNAGEDDKLTRSSDNGAVIVAQYTNRLYAGFRPTKVEAARKQIETLEQAMLSEGETFLPLQNPAAIAAMLRSDGFAAFAERVEDTPVPEGGYEANPAASVPKLVAKVVKATDLSTEGATLYLQMLALAEPTERNIQLYNGWTPKQYKAAAAELAKAKLVVEGKRERAGRSIFLKGGYSKGTKKALPTEDWRQPFYGVLDRESLPTEPIHLVFARAWKRIEDGDVPK